MATFSTSSTAAAAIPGISALCNTTALKPPAHLTSGIAHLVETGGALPVPCIPPLGQASAAAKQTHSCSSHHRLPSSAESPLHLSRTLAAYKQPLPGKVSGVNAYGSVAIGASSKKEKDVIQRESSPEQDKEKISERTSFDTLRWPGFGIGFNLLRSESGRREREKMELKKSSQSSMLYSFPSSLLVQTRKSDNPSWLASTSLAYSTSASSSTSSSTTSSDSPSKSLTKPLPNPEHISPSSEPISLSPNDISSLKPGHSLAASAPASTTGMPTPPANDEELRQRMEEVASRDGGITALDIEDGKPVAMKRSVRVNMFRYI